MWVSIKGAGKKKLKRFILEIVIFDFNKTVAMMVFLITQPG